MNLYAPERTPDLPHLGRSEPVVPNAVLATLIFVVAEAMMFAGLISAFAIVKTASLGAWPPAGQPRLPVEETLFNTLALLASGVLVYVAQRAFAREPQGAARPLLAAIGLGAFFVLFQGYEWQGLIREGLTLTSSNHGSFFYLIVGMHALHAIAALILLGQSWLLLRAGQLAQSRFYGVQLFWYFVVGLWPILYLLVYL